MDADLMSGRKVIHVLRAPVGGLFRHVRDLVREQAATGLQVGMICDSSSGDRLTSKRLDALSDKLSLGLFRTAMSRNIAFGDFGAYRAIREHAVRVGADVLHGHGAKGGAYARLVAASLKRQGSAIKSFYTPHGGSLNFDPAGLQGAVYMMLERQLAHATDGIIFESAWSERIYRDKVGEPRCPVRVIPNGLLPRDFVDHRPRPDAADFVFVGELRPVKGIDVLLQALARIDDRKVSALIVGDGPQRDELQQLAERLGLSDRVQFPGAMPALEAFDHGRVLVIPSRAESFPYIILEAAAAGIPLVATDVGGIPEIVGQGKDTGLVVSDDVPALTQALEAVLDTPDRARERAVRLKQRVAACFTVERMTREIVSFYDAAGKFARESSRLRVDA
jgi:glycosyltransferase involved in cell wall biosynthesis